MKYSPTLLSLLIAGATSFQLQPRSLLHPSPSRLFYFDDVNTPEPSTSSVDSAALVSSISDWTKTNLLSPNFSKSSSSTFSDEGGVNLDYKIIDSTTSLTALSSLYSHLSSLPVNPPPNTCTMLIFSHPFTYDTFSLIDKTLDFSLPLCKDLEGKVITHYHPGFKNAPRLLYVGRHSPYPVFSVTVKSVEEGEDNMIVFNEGITDGGGAEIGSREESPKNEAPAGSTGKLGSTTASFSNLKTSIEHLYNRAAASSTVDSLKGPPQLRNAKVRITTNNNDIIEDCKNWVETTIKESQRTGGVQSSREVHHKKRSKENTAEAGRVIPDPLQYSESIKRWTVSEGKVASDVFSDFWKVAAEVYEEGQNSSKQKSQKYNSNNWLESLTSSVSKTQPPAHSVISTMFITPNFSTFNSEQYKKFAVSISPALERLTEGKMFISVFHPEYVTGVKGGESERRRSDWPMIQVCYEA